MKTTEELIQVTATGAGIIVDASLNTTADLIRIITAAGLAGSVVVIRHSYEKTSLELIQIASLYPKNVTFDFT